MPPKVDEVSQPLREEKPAACSCRVPSSRTASTPGEKEEPSTRDLPVALDEHEQDVLAAQVGQQPVARRVAVAVVADLGAKRARSRRPACTALHLVDGQVGGARGGDAARRRRAARRTPSRAPRRRRAPRRPGATCRRWPAATRVRRSTARVGRTSSGDAEQRRRRRRPGSRPSADRVAQRLDADGGVAPVVDGIERPVEGREEADVEELHEHQQAERRPDHPGQERAGRRRAGRGPAR